MPDADKMLERPDSGDTWFSYKADFSWLTGPHAALRSRYVTISSLAFSMDSQFLCASSNTETVHIFKLEHLASR